MDLGLADKVALVTGGSRGIGASIAYALAREGCDVAVLHWEDSTGAEEVVQGVELHGRRVHVVESDVTRFDAAEQTVREVIEKLGRLDILVCNAAMASDRVRWEMSEEQWDRVLAVNLKGCFNFCHAVAPVFRDQGAGRIVNIASITGLRGRLGQVNYAASKGGMVALTKSVARDLGRAGVTVNAVAPGMIQSEMIERLPEEMVERARAESAVGRIGDPEDVASLVAFLCSDHARHVTGQCIQVDGGQYT